MISQFEDALSCDFQRLKVRSVFGLVTNRLGLDTWKANVHEKLKTLDDVYRFAVEQSTASRGQFLELTVVLILVLELVLVFMGVMK